MTDAILGNRGSMKVLGLLSLIFCIFSVKSFAPRSRIVTYSSLKMGGGRSPAESKSGAGGGRATERSMFKELRQKLNTAAEQPGFFDTAAGKPVSCIFFRSYDTLKHYRSDLP